MDSRTKKGAVTIASAALAITAAGALVDTGSAAAPSAGRGAAPALAAEGWPGGARLTAREAVREARAAAREHPGAVLKLTEVELRSRFVDVGRTGESPGDIFMWESALYTPDGERAGRDSIACTIRIRTYACEGTLQLTGRGKITASDVFFGNEQQVAVTGGTREFSGVGGQVFPVEEGDTTVLVVHVVH